MMEPTEWIAEQVSHVGEQVLHTEQIRSGPAGYVLAVQTDTRRCYFKACAAIAAFEPRLVAALEEWLPGSVPHVIAVHDEQNWFLMADAGPTVRELIRADGDRSRSESMLRRFAAIQQGAIPYTEQILALGVPDRRLDRLPDLYARLIADADALMIGHPDGLSETDAARLAGFEGTLRALCEELAAYNLPQTLQHDDFHSANAGISDEHMSFFDWGEVFIAHPFYSLLIALRDAKYTLNYDEPTLARLRDIYLAHWVDYEPMERLRQALAITHRLAALGRALTWWEVLTHADDSYRVENADAVPYWLLTCLNDTPLDLE
jgi:hypothetical protein